MENDSYGRWKGAGARWKVIAPIERFFVKNRPFSRGYPAGRNITIGIGVIHRN